MNLRTIALLLACLPLAAHAQVPLNTLSTAGAPASTDTFPVCQTVAGCGTGNSLLSAQESYIGRAAVSGSRGNPQFNGGAGFASNAQVINVGLLAGVDPTGVSDSSAGINTAITTAQGMTPCATLYFPAGKYLINAATIVTGSTEGCSFVGEGGRSYDQDDGTTFFTTNTSFTLMSVNDACTGSIVAAGPTIRGITFSEEDGGATKSDTLLKICNVNRELVVGNSFRNGLYGVLVEPGTCGTCDASDGMFAFNLFIKNATNYSQQQNGSTATWGQNKLISNYFITSGHSGISIDCENALDGGLSIVGNRLDGPGLMVYSSCFQLGITGGNTIEGGFDAVARADQTAGGNAGKDLSIVGNIINVPSTPAPPFANTCTTSTSSLTWSCSATSANLQNGMELVGTGVFAYSAGTFAFGTNNQISGGTYVVSFVPNTSITVSHLGTANGATTVNACPAIGETLAGTFPMAIVGNQYASAQNCESVNGNLGQ